VKICPKLKIGLENLILKKSALDMPDNQVLQNYTSHEAHVILGH